MKKIIKKTIIVAAEREFFDIMPKSSWNMTQNVKKDGKNESNRSYEHMQTRGTSGKVCLKKKRREILPWITREINLLNPRIGSIWKSTARRGINFNVLLAAISFLLYCFDHFSFSISHIWINHLLYFITKDNITITKWEQILSTLNSLENFKNPCVIKDFNGIWILKSRDKFQ